MTAPHSYYELEQFKDPFGLNTHQESYSGYIPDFDELYPDIFAPNTSFFCSATPRSLPTGRKVDTATPKDKEDTVAERLKTDPFGWDTGFLPDDPDYLGPWPDLLSDSDDEEPPCVQNPSCALQLKAIPTIWCELPEEVKHYLLKVATDFQLYQHQSQSQDLTAAKTRKSVFQKALYNLAIEDGKVVENLFIQHLVKRKKVTADAANFSPTRHSSTLSPATNSKVADIVSQAKVYVDRLNRELLLPAIAQSEYRIQPDLLNTEYFGFPEFKANWQPAPDSKAAKQAVAAFRITTSGKAKCSERLLVRYIDLPQGSFVYGLTGILPLQEAGRYTFTYPETTSRLLEKRDGKEILLCKAAP